MESNTSTGKPCKECPFRKESFPGYLGEASGQPSAFLESMEYSLLPCHMAIDWDTATDSQIEDAAWKTPCIGALQFCNNTAKTPRGARIPGAYSRHLSSSGRNEEVFSTRTDFIEHHGKQY